MAVGDPALELNYTRAVADLLLHVLVPPPHLESRTGRFVVGELITCNVLLPFFARLSDPDWLNALIVQVCGGPAEPGAPPASGPPPEPPPQQEAEPHKALPPNAAATPPTGYDAVDSEEASRPQDGAGEEPANDSEPDSPSADCKQTPSDSLCVVGQGGALLSGQRECSVDTDLHQDGGCPGTLEVACPRLLVNSQPVEGVSVVGAGDSLKVADREGPPLQGIPSRDLLLSVEQSSPGEPSEVSPLQGPSPVPPFSFDPLSSPDGPVLIQNLRITGTITAKEHRGTGSHPYTLYTIKVSLSPAPHRTRSCVAPRGMEEGLGLGVPVVTCFRLVPVRDGDGLRELGRSGRRAGGVRAPPPFLRCLPHGQPEVQRVPQPADPAGGEGGATEADQG